MAGKAARHGEAGQIAERTEDRVPVRRHLLGADPVRGRRGDRARVDTSPKVADQTKYTTWHMAGASPSTPESATGLGTFGQVRRLDPPHSQENFVMREIACRIARKHARTLRLQAQNLGFALPFRLAIVPLFVAGWPATDAAAAAALGSFAGSLIERRLFFAEANHAITRYYGERSV